MRRTPRRRTPRRRLLVALLAVTLVLMALDVAGGPGPAWLRAAGGAAFGPLQRMLTPAHDGDVRRADDAHAAAEADLAAAEARGATQLAALLRAPETRDRRFVPARVVAVGRPGASGPERVTIDVGSRDGLRTDLSVVNADGLVGRVVSVSPWTSDVLLVGADDLTVGVRVGLDGTLGSVGGTVRDRRTVPAGQLALDLVQHGRISTGDMVSTLGSVGGVPFQPGLRVGVVAQVDGSAGQLVPTSTVTPAVDVRTLDVVGVLIAPRRSTPRVPATGGG